ncbi:hypothetical protein [Paraburkholderia metrosideri]|jgi:hypothetical protein|uniref:hypothetical protein n=1 Tax=Paraburkholderia metrosideri TaxID=580937 RepID=UPI00191A1448|nr:hypothetical protein [Paraburkholderia metrosideri]
MNTPLSETGQKISSPPHAENKTNLNLEIKAFDVATSTSARDLMHRVARSIRLA